MHNTQALFFFPTTVMLKKQRAKASNGPQVLQQPGEEEQVDTEGFLLAPTSLFTVAS